VSIALGSIHALAFEEFESPEDKVVKIESLEELALLTSGLI
jgi:hypothetical protein